MIFEVFVYTMIINGVQNNSSVLADGKYCIYDISPFNIKIVNNTTTDDMWQTAHVFL